MYAYLISKKILPLSSYQRPLRLSIFDFEEIVEPEVIQKGEILTPARLLKNVSDLYAYSFWKFCRPVRLLKTVRLLETLEYHTRAIPPKKKSLHFIIPFLYFFSR